jgi:phosphoglycolate phosphatase/putative hydrolase of the HAD superfamily
MNVASESIAWKDVKAVILDVDGTLYNQKVLRGKMMKALLGYYLLRPWKYNELKIISIFRKEREVLPTLKATHLEEVQYEICAKKANQPLSLVKKVIDQWIFTYPLPFLRESMYAQVPEFFDLLRTHQIKISIYSDYKALEKLQAMGLQADLVVCSTDAAIDCMKPDPKALHYITGKLKVDIKQCVFIGDRDELDGACARSVSMPYIIVDKDPKGETDLYSRLCEEVRIGSRQ